jgi:hypothetical protein
LFWYWNIDFRLLIKTGNERTITSLNFLLTLPDELELMDFCFLDGNIMLCFWICKNNPEFFCSYNGISTFGLYVEPLNEGSIHPSDFFLLSSGELELHDYFFLSSSIETSRCTSEVGRSNLSSSCSDDRISNFGLPIEPKNKKSIFHYDFYSHKLELK